MRKFQSFVKLLQIIPQLIQNYQKLNYIKLSLTNTQVSKLCKAFANNSSADMKLSNTELHKIAPSGGFLGRLLGP